MIVRLGLHRMVLSLGSSLLAAALGAGRSVVGGIEPGGSAAAGEQAALIRNRGEAVRLCSERYRGA